MDFTNEDLIYAKEGSRKQLSYYIDKETGAQYQMVDSPQDMMQVQRQQPLDNTAVQCYNKA